MIMIISIYHILYIYYILDYICCGRYTASYEYLLRSPASCLANQRPPITDRDKDSYRYVQIICTKKYISANVYIHK